LTTADRAHKAGSSEPVPGTGPVVYDDEIIAAAAHFVKGDFLHPVVFHNKVLSAGY
jgi:hypothetical protein